MATSARAHPAPINLPILELLSAMHIPGSLASPSHSGRPPRPQLPRATYLCRTVDPAARAATALLGERPEEPTLVPLGVGPGCREKQTVNIKGWVLFTPPTLHPPEMLEEQ